MASSQFNTDRSTAPETLAQSEPSLCIARLPAGFSDGVVHAAITDLGFGTIDRVDIVQKTDRNGEDYNMAFIHFKQWSTDADVAEDRFKLHSGEKIKIIYESASGDYFMLGRSYAKRPENRNGQRTSNNRGYNNRKRRVENTKPFVDMDGWTTMPAKRSRRSASIEVETGQPESNDNSNSSKRSTANGFAGLLHEDDSDGE